MRLAKQEGGGGHLVGTEKRKGGDTLLIPAKEIATEKIHDSGEREREKEHFVDTSTVAKKSAKNMNLGRQRISRTATVERIWHI
jgi:hypothetical protein